MLLVQECMPHQLPVLAERFCPHLPLIAAMLNAMSWLQRLLLCATKGFKGALLDWLYVDNSNSNTGFSTLTQSDLRAHATWMSAVARNMGLLVGFFEASRGSEDISSASSATLFDFTVSLEIQKNSLLHFAGLAGG
jgi:hypothetical protein